MREIPWYKIKLISKLLQSRPDAGYIIWNDADIMITNYDYKITDIISKYKQADIIVTKEHSNVLNTGTIIVRNTEFSKNMMQKIWDNSIPSRPDFHEQSSFSDLYTQNTLNCQEHVHIIPNMSELFVYWWGYMPGSFQVQITRCIYDIPGFIFTIDLFCSVRRDEDSDADFRQRIKWLSTIALCRKDLDDLREGTYKKERNVRDIGYCHPPHKTVPQYYLGTIEKI